LDHAGGILFNDGQDIAVGKENDPTSVRAVRGGLCGTLGDSDGDTICDNIDNCPDNYNLFQMDCESDGEGDICDVDTIDPDDDGVDVECDNCPNDSNTGQKDCDNDGEGDACEANPDDRDDDWDNHCNGIDKCPNFYNLDNTDTYPPQGNGIGDACDCEGDFACDGDVDGSDASTFKADFGRSVMVNPCIAGDTCNGDFSCDGDVDGTDASLFKADFGRNSLQNPCPICVTGVVWCVYSN
jgi:hypothetical protein